MSSFSYSWLPDPPKTVAKVFIRCAECGYTTEYPKLFDLHQCFLDDFNEDYLE